jgi:hypothetical protein
MHTESSNSVKEARMTRRKFSFNSLIKKNLNSPTSFVRPCFLAMTLGLCVILPQHGIAATVTYSSGNYRAVIGNGSAPDSLYGYGEQIAFKTMTTTSTRKEIP